jgi:uncharacterized cupin superfamily protein
MSKRASSADADGIYVPFPAEEPPLESFDQGKYGSRYRVLSKFGGGSHVGVVHEELPPGKQSNQQHYHMLEEEHVYILEGALTLLLGAKRHLMQAGDYVCFPAGQKVGHALFNHTDAPCRYILIGENNPNDVSVYPETGRVGVRLMGEGYRKSAVMDYWEGSE